MVTQAAGRGVATNAKGLGTTGVNHVALATGLIHFGAGSAIMVSVT